MSGYDPKTLETLRKALDETWALVSEERDGCRTLKNPVPSTYLTCLRLAVETLRKARELPPGSERNELRQVAMNLRWIAKRTMSAREVRAGEHCGASRASPG
jgi:hypothetical protein